MWMEQQPHCHDIVMMCYDMALALFGQLWKSNDPQTQTSNIHIGSFVPRPRTSNSAMKNSTNICEAFPHVLAWMLHVCGVFIYAPLSEFQGCWCR